MEWNEIKHFTLSSSSLKLASVEVSMFSPHYDEVVQCRLAVDEVYLKQHLCKERYNLHLS